MCIVLLEPAYASQSGQCSMNLIAVEDSEISHAQRQVPVAFLGHVEHQAVAGTVHGLDPVLRGVRVNEEHELPVLEIVPGYFPQLVVVDIRGDHFPVAPDSVLVPHEIEQSVVNVRAVGEEECGTWRHCVEVIEVLLWADVAMVPC